MSNNKNFVVKNGLDVGLDITANNVTANTFIGDLTGNADTASALATSRTITLGGDLSGNTAFDGSANITITAAVADDSHNHTIANVDDLQTTLDDKLDSGDIGSTVLAYDSNLQSFVTAFTLPTVDGSNTQILVTDGAGNLSFADISNPLELYAENPVSPTAPSATGTNAVAIGRGAQASGADSFAVGDISLASGADSISLGRMCRATYGYAVAIGYDCDSLANYTVAMGYRATASGSNAVAAGASADYTKLANASGNGSVALGGSISAGADSVSLGVSYNSGASSFAAVIDNNTSSYGATGTNAIAIGQLAKATNTNSIAIGDSALSTTANLIALGGTTDTVQISGAYTLPTSDGANNQVLTTDGAGGVTFADISNPLELYAENPDSPTAPSATGTNAVAIGNGSTASSTESVAIGDSTSSGVNSIAIGENSTSSGNRSTAIGRNSFAGGADATAVGSYSVATTGSYANAFGHHAYSYGQDGTSIGRAYSSGTDSFAAAIANNTSSYGATGANSVAIGKQAKATGQYNIVLATEGSATGTYSTIIGGKAGSDNGVWGKFVFPASFLNGGQQGLFVLREATTDATASTLRTNGFSAGTTNQIILPNNSAYAFHGTIVARQQAADGTDCAAWKIEGLIRREGSAGTTVLVNSATTVLDNTPSWGMTLSADTTNGGLAITVTGAAATNIRWVATVHTSEVTYT